MARRPNALLLDLSRQPWPVGLSLGLVLLIGGKVILPAMLAASNNKFLNALGHAFDRGGLAWLIGILTLVCWFAAFVSWRGRRQRQQLLEDQTSLASLKTITWRAFEQWVGEAFRRRGYVVEETGLGGADGGIDLILTRHGQTTLVQCKQWKTQRVGVSVAREMFGLLSHHQAHEVIIVTTGSFTAEAQAFATGKPIRLLTGNDLLALIREVQTTAISAMPAAEPSPIPEPSLATAIACPRCGSKMVERKARRTGEQFLGCEKFPSCRGTRVLGILG